MDFVAKHPRILVSGPANSVHVFMCLLCFKKIRMKNHPPVNQPTWDHLRSTGRTLNLAPPNWNPPYVASKRARDVTSWKHFLGKKHTLFLTLWNYSFQGFLFSSNVALWNCFIHVCFLFWLCSCDFLDFEYWIKLSWYMFYWENRSVLIWTCMFPTSFHSCLFETIPQLGWAGQEKTNRSSVQIYIVTGFPSIFPYFFHELKKTMKKISAWKTIEQLKLKQWQQCTNTIHMKLIYLPTHLPLKTHQPSMDIVKYTVNSSHGFPVMGYPPHLRLRRWCPWRP